MRANLAIVILLFLIGCIQENPEVNNLSDQPVSPSVYPPEFKADSAYSYIQKQVNFGPRVPNTQPHKECRDYLIEKLQSYGLKVTAQNGVANAFDGTKLNFTNIIAAYRPEEKSRILLCAHWDTRPFADQDKNQPNMPILGANDGGSGVGVLLEIARQFSIKNPTIGVDIILFDAEDYGQPENSGFPIMQNSWCLGSQYWSNNPHKASYFARYGILLDMVGAENATFRHEEISFYYGSTILQKVWRKASRLGFGNYFVFENAKQIMDDHYYVNTITGIPTIDIIEYDPSTKSNFNKHWHTHKDDMDNIDKNTLNAVGQTLLEVIYNE